MLGRSWNEEQQRQHAGTEDGHVLNDVQIREHSSLTVQFVVEVSLRSMRAGPCHGIAAAMSAEHPFKLCHLIHKGLIA